MQQIRAKAGRNLQVASHCRTTGHT